MFNSRKSWFFLINFQKLGGRQNEKTEASNLTYVTLDKGNSFTRTYKMEAAPVAWPTNLNQSQPALHCQGKHLTVKET